MSPGAGRCSFDGAMRNASTAMPACSVSRMAHPTTLRVCMSIGAAGSPVTTREPLAVPSARCSSTLATAPSLISGPQVTPSSTVAGDERADGLGHFSGESVVDALLH